MSATDHALSLVRTAALAASDKLAERILAFDVSETLAVTDAFVLASASNDRQVRAIAEEIEDRIREEHGEKPLRREGHQQGRWILLDFADVVIHVQHSDERAFYSLDRLWRDCPGIALPAEVGEFAGEHVADDVEDDPDALAPPII